MKGRRENRRERRDEAKTYFERDVRRILQKQVVRVRALERVSLLHGSRLEDRGEKDAPRATARRR